MLKWMGVWIPKDQYIGRLPNGLRWTIVFFILIFFFFWGGGFPSLPLNNKLLQVIFLVL